jgi:hypothetical protein
MEFVARLALGSQHMQRLSRHLVFSPIKESVHRPTLTPTFFETKS